MAKQRKAFPRKVSNPTAKARATLNRLRREEKERERQRKAFEKLKLGGN